MASLQSLPTELIVSIFCATDIYAAVKLSSVNRRLHKIWLDNTSAIVESILAPQIPAYKEAVDLAMTEYSFAQHSAEIKMGDWMPCLLRNAEMASKVCSEFQSYYDEEAARCPPNLRVLDISTAPLESSYYLVRLSVLAYHHRELIPRIISKLEADSTDLLQIHRALYLYIMNDVSDEVREKHAIDLPEERSEGDKGVMPEWDAFGPVELVVCAIRGRFIGEMRGFPNK